MQKAGQGNTDATELAWVEGGALVAGVKTEITRLTLTIDSEEAIHNLPEAEENRCRLNFEKEYARKIKRQQE